MPDRFAGGLVGKARVSTDEWIETEVEHRPSCHTRLKSTTRAGNAMHRRGLTTICHAHRRSPKLRQDAPQSRFIRPDP